MNQNFIKATLLFCCILLTQCADKTPTKVNTISAPDTLTIFNTKVFYAGANWPWMNYGHDFGQAKWPTGYWAHDGISSTSTYSSVSAQINSIGTAGIRYLRIFLLCDGRASPEFDSAGYVTVFDEYFFNDLDSLISICRRNQIKLAVSLMDYYWLDTMRLGSNGVQIGGHRDIVTDSNKTKSFINNCLIPITQRYGHDTVIASWELMNEPEWRMQGLQLNQFFALCIETIHARTLQPVTIGCAKYSLVNTWSSLNLDFYQVHCYEKTRDAPPFIGMSGLNNPKPVIVGEFPTASSPISMAEYLDGSWQHGYAGVFAWSINGKDESSNLNSSLLNELGHWCLVHNFSNIYPL